MRILLDEHFAHFVTGDGDDVEVKVELKHTDLDHVFVGSNDHTPAIFEVKLPKGNGLKANTKTFKAWLIGTRFRTK